MKIASHLDKFHRLDITKGKLDPQEDSELWIWTAMTACTHLLNAALHQCAATQETDSFHTQVEGVYACPNRADGLLHDATHPPGDVIHIGQPPVTGPLPSTLVTACVALKVIENLREPYVIGTAVATSELAISWQRIYDQCVACLFSVLTANVAQDRCESKIIEPRHNA